MKANRLKPLVIALVVAGAAGAVLADSKLGNFGAQGTKDKTASPFGFAESGKKADRNATQPEDAGGKVIGGELADEGEWPWQVALTVAAMPVSPDSQFCGGSLVMDEWVLTAAHCVHMMDDQGTEFDVHPTELSIVAGTTKLDGSGDVIPVEAIFPHPSYTATGLDYDIALIKLARKPNVPYKTVEVPDADFGDILQQPGVTTVVTGWGLQNGGRMSPELREVQIQMLDREMCNTAMMEARAEEAAAGFSYAAQVLSIAENDAYALWDEMLGRAPMPISENMICSGTFEGGKTSCNGDSGGPLVVPLEDGSYIQAGIVSWGLSAASGQGCEENAMFSAYTNISAFIPWLNEVIASNP
ncbi:serine protease [Rhodobacter sp. Har01]|uniref:serine protease n=1 Tax=Rhodobacter sp. Har01 TaxID=2883999 RepID=UPI001D07219B|nr:serine protease [Rhodobacter sp. Har01]MCB6179599.1 serine protease [Rhodobacter sp. Har01]